MDYHYDKKTIEDTFNEIQNVTNVDGYLDHAVRAVEEYIRTRLKKHESVGEERKFSIKKVNKNSEYSIGKAYINVYLNGANIFYSNRVSNAQKRFLIAHELGHIVLHGFDENGNLITGVIKEPRSSEEETQASYFAKKVLEYRSEQYKDQDFVKAYIYNGDELDMLIKKCCSVYDEGLLVSSESK